MKERLDVLLVKKGFYQSRERAKASIMAGIVYVDGQKSDKAGNMIDTEAEITVKENICPYVSRGGLKLEKSMKIWDIKLENAVCMDIGASTGGFTDCMLQNGAEKVYSVDVGTNQLDEKLRNDRRVISMEQTDIRNCVGVIPAVDFISIDVSFISLKLILPTAYSLLKDGGECVALIKPQFEAGKAYLSKNGIVRDTKIHKKVCDDISAFAASIGFSVYENIPSPITGGDGNTEYLILLRRTKAGE